MNTSDAPLVSVVMPVYNGERFLAEAIESVLDQTLPDFELIVIDDGSTDATASILEQYTRRDTRIRVVTHKVAHGYGGEKASNAAYKLAKGKYIAKLDADDIAHPARLAKQVAFLEENPAFFLVGTFLELIDADGHVTGTRNYPVTHRAIYQNYYYRNGIGHPSVMFQNSVIKGDFYTLRFPALNDYYSFFLLMNAGYQIANLPECLVQYRIHDTNTVFTNLRRNWEINMAIKRSFVDEFGFQPPTLHRILLRLITLGINLLPERFLVRIMNQTRKLINA